MFEPAEYQWSDDAGWFLHKVTGEPAPRLACPRAVVPDIAPYLSPVTGEYISGRRAKRADLERHNCIDASDMPSPTGGKFKNRKFAEKRGLTHLLKEDAK